MELTNRLNLPSTIVSAIQRDPYHQDGDISATGLIQPPRIRQLNSRYRGEITADVADRMWVLFGQMFHYVLEKANTENAIVEKRLSTTINGWKVTGQADLYEDEILYDYKFTTIWSYVYGLKSEWESQVNIYSELFRQHYPVKALKIIMGLRDWNKRKANGPDYPDSQIVMVDVPLWLPEDAHEYMTERVTLHQEAEGLKDEDLPLCSPNERWYRGDTFAVMKATQKRAKRVLDTEEDAEKWIDNLPEKKREGLRVEKRIGENVRCLDYCDCSKFCSFGKQLKGGE